MTCIQLRTLLARLPDHAPILGVAADFGDGSDTFHDLDYVAYNRLGGNVELGASSHCCGCAPSLDMNGEPGVLLLDDDGNPDGCLSPIASIK